MNSYERKQLERLQTSRDCWKIKAKNRNHELRKSRQRIKELHQSRDRWRSRHEQQKQHYELEQVRNRSRVNPIYFTVVSLSIELNLSGNVSFRSIPKVLALMNKYLSYLGIPIQFMIPHFSSVINWSLRVGHFLMARQLRPIAQKWICIMDHTFKSVAKKRLLC